MISVTLSRIAADIELGEIADELAPLHPRINTFPAEVLLDLAAHAIEESGSTRDDPIETETIRQRLLPEDRAHTAAQHRKAEFSIRAAAMVASTSSSARAFFAQLRLPRKVWQTWRRFPVTGSRPVSTISAHTSGARSRIPGAARNLPCRPGYRAKCWISAGMLDFRSPGASESAENPGHLGAPGRTRTCDLRIRSPLLYPSELRRRADRHRTR